MSQTILKITPYMSWACLQCGYLSQHQEICPNCGKNGKVKDFHPSYRKFKCTNCGYEEDRDPIAARISGQKTNKTRKSYKNIPNCHGLCYRPGGLTTVIPTFYK
jgi:hypothetical protein